MIDTSTTMILADGETGAALGFFFLVCAIPLLLFGLIVYSIYDVVVKTRQDIPMRVALILSLISMPMIGVILWFCYFRSRVANRDKSARIMPNGDVVMVSKPSGMVPYQPVQPYGPQNTGGDVQSPQPSNLYR